MARPVGGSRRSDACLEWHQRPRFYVILISDGKSEVKSVGKLKMGFLKMENKNLLFFQIFVLHQGTWVRPWMGGSPQSFKKHLSLSDIQNWSASEGKGSCLTGLRHEELQVSGRKQKCVWCLGSFSGCWLALIWQGKLTRWYATRRPAGGSRSIRNIGWSLRHSDI